MQIIAALARTAPFQRFAASIETLIPEWAADGSAPPLLLAVSGGPDSLAMLAMAAACFPERIAAMTVDHGLRAEAAEEARFVGVLCAQLAVPHRIATAAPFASGANVQAAARMARYDLLQREADRLGGAFILTAHHHDDQLETILMRLARGSGVAGMCGIRPRNGRIIRPLLGFTKDELSTICTEMGWQAAEDPSNTNDQFDRVRMRRILEQCDLPIAPEALARSAKAMRESDEALCWMVDRLAPTYLTLEKSIAVLTPADLPVEIVRRLILRALSHLGEAEPRGEQVERAMAALFVNQPACIGHCLVKPSTKGAPKWHFGPAPPRRLPRNVRE